MGAHPIREGVEVARKIHRPVGSRQSPGGSQAWRPARALEGCKDTHRAKTAPNHLRYGSSMTAPAITLPPTPPLRALTDVIVAAGGRPVAVGGAIRDAALGLPAKDIDVEVFGLGLAPLEDAFVAAGFSVHAVGRSFGVLKVQVSVDLDGETHTDVIDVALPRTESKVGEGHRGFVVESDPNLDFRAAAARRDFTINAIGIDLQSGEVLDPWGGVGDLDAKVLRHVSDAFDEDPLRVLRCAQFAARFGFNVDDGTLSRCQALRNELPTLARERLLEELKKLLVKGVWPSVGLQVLQRVGAVEVLFPELHALIGCPQEYEWHPEGDVWTHTLMVVDEAARIARHDKLDEGDTFAVVFAALCHDLGKPATTTFEEGRLRSRGHESQGETPTRTLCARLGVANDVEELTVALVRDHLKPFMLWKDRENLSDGAIRRLAMRTPIPMLARVAAADHLGRTTVEALAGDEPATPWLLEVADRLRVKDGAPTPILQGRDLQALGHRPGKHFGAVLKAAFEAQLEGVFDDRDAAVDWLAQHIESLMAEHSQ